VRPEAGPDVIAITAQCNDVADTRSPISRGQMVDILARRAGADHMRGGRHTQTVLQFNDERPSRVARAAIGAAGGRDEARRKGRQSRDGRHRIRTDDSGGCGKHFKRHREIVGD
jgi:hypothetical protein